MSEENRVLRKMRYLKKLIKFSFYFNVLLIKLIYNFTIEHLGVPLTPVFSALKGENASDAKKCIAELVIYPLHG
jgi:hypothetical protein